MQQQTEEWYRARCGKVTASRVADVIARIKSGWGASRTNYAAELIAERLTGLPAPGFVNDAMRWGTDTEPQARAAYQFHCDLDVTEVGFIDHPKIAMSGASPDGLVGEDGLVEIKCPSTATHLDTLLSGDIPDKYIVQMHWQMVCTGRSWCDFCSFDPRLPEQMRLFVYRVTRDDKRAKDLEGAVQEFLAEIDGKVRALREKYQLAEAA